MIVKAYMTEDEKVVTERSVTPPSVAMLYRRGLVLATKAAELAEYSNDAAHAQACAAAAQAQFAAIQAASFAAAALDIVSDVSDDDTSAMQAQRKAVAAWQRVIEMAGGR